MSFAFPQIDPETSGQVLQMYVPLDRYLSASFDQGQHDSAFNSVMRMEQLHLDNVDGSPMLAADEANKRFAVGDLKFDEPVSQSAALTMSNRKKAEMDRNFFLSQGASRGRFLPGMAASILGGVSNPLDLGLMFVPFVGEEKVAAKLAEGGAGAIRQAIARGLITQEAINASKVPVPRLIGSVMQGAMSQAPFELLNLAASKQDHADYTGADAFRNIVGGGALAGVLHSMGRLWEKLSFGTKDAMMQQAVNQFLQDEDIRVHNYVQLDESVIRDKVKFDVDKAKYEALGTINEDALKQKIFDLYHEKVVAPAMMLEDGTLVRGKPGEVHIDLLRQLSDERLDKMTHEETIEGFLTESGRFVSREEAAKMMGMNNDFYASENITNEGSLDWMSPDEFDHAHKLMEEGMSKSDAINQTLALREQMKRKFFFERPDIQEKLKVERQRQIDDYIEKQRSQYDENAAFTREVQAEIKSQQEAGRVLTEEQINKYLSPDKSFVEQSTQMIDKDVENLKKNLIPQEEQQAQTKLGRKVLTDEQMRDLYKEAEKKARIYRPDDNTHPSEMGVPFAGMEAMIAHDLNYDLIDLSPEQLLQFMVGMNKFLKERGFPELTVPKSNAKGEAYSRILGNAIKEHLISLSPEPPFLDTLRGDLKDYIGAKNESEVRTLMEKKLLKQNAEWEMPDTLDADQQSQIDRETPEIMKDLEKYYAHEKENKANQFPPAEQAILDSVPKPQEKSIDVALDCLIKKIV